jgi:hypothetical protein
MPVALSPLEERTLPDNKVTNVVVGASPPEPTQLSPVTPSNVRSLVAPEPAKQFTDKSVVNSLIKPDDSDPYSNQNTEAMRTLVNWTQNPNAENNQKVAKVIEDKNKEDLTGHINTQTQWGGVLASLLSRNYMGAWKFYNGGPKEYEEAFSPVHGYAVKEFNANGFTGRYFKKNDKGELAPLDPNVINDIEKKGGYFISKRDTTASNDARYQGASDLAKQAMTGAPQIVLNQYKTAAETANKASSYANLLQNRQAILLRKDANGQFTNTFLDKIGHLNPAQLADLYQAQIEFKTLNKNLSTSQRAGNAANVQLTDTENKKLGLQGNLGFGQNQLSPEGAIAPSVGGGLTGGLSTSGTNAVGTSATTGAETGQSQGITNQIQQQFLNKVQSIIGEQIKTPQQFSDLQNYLSTTAEINNLASSLDLENKAPGTTAVSKIYDPLLSGRKNILLQDLQGQKNASLLASWESFLAKRINETNGQPSSRDQLAEEFAKTNTAKGINYLYDNRMNSVLSNKAHAPKEGDVTVNPKTHRPEIFRKGEWESLNER